MSPVDNHSYSLPGPPAPQAALQRPRGLSMLGALETLSNGSVYQLLVPKGPSNGIYSYLWASDCFHGSGAGQWAA